MTMPPQLHEITRCRVCGSSSLARVLDLGRQSLTGRFPRPRDPDPMSGPLELVLCSDKSQGGCGLLQLAHSYPPTEMYGPTYGYRSSNNQTTVAHLRAKIANLVRIARPLWQEGRQPVVEIVELRFDVWRRLALALRSLEAFGAAGVVDELRQGVDGATGADGVRFA